MNTQDRLTANLKKLPVTCYFVPPVKLDPTNKLLRIVRGEEGYYPADNQIHKDETPEAARDRLNAGVFTHDKKPVTIQQTAAMFNGSLFGFHNPAADPDMYDAEGRPQVASMVSGLHAKEIPAADSLYPEHDRVEAIREQSETLVEFLEWLVSQGYTMARPHEHAMDCFTLGRTPTEFRSKYGPDGDGIATDKEFGEGKFSTPQCGLAKNQLLATNERVEDVLNRFFQLDPAKLETEKRAMLAALRA